MVTLDRASALLRHLLSKLLHFIAEERTAFLSPAAQERVYRSQLINGHFLILVGILMTLPVPKPSLWILEDWGGFEISPYIWAIIFSSTGLALTRAKRISFAVTLNCLGFVQIVTVGAAAYLTQGPSVTTCFAAVLGLHAMWTASDLHNILLRRSRL